MREYNKNEKKETENNKNAKLKEQKKDISAIKSWEIEPWTLEQVKYFLYHVRWNYRK
jgi:hypothetical protein